jgi:hypothetical protein
MNKAKQTGGFDLRHRKAKLITVMAAAILSILILVGCPNDGGPGPDTPPDKTVKGLVISGGTVVKGSYLDLSASLIWSDGSTNTPTTQVTWSITEPNNPVIGTNINSSGRLSVSSNETANTIKVKADYTGGGDISGTEDITVNTPNEGNKPTVTSVTINANKFNILNNNSDSINLTVTTVEGSNNPNGSVTWIVSAGTTTTTGVKLSKDSGSSTTLTVDTTGVPGTIKVKGESNITSGVLSNEIEITIDDDNPPSPPTATDFKQKTNANLLGLYPASDYTSGSAVISAMNARAANATSMNFYNTSSTVTSVLGGGIPGADGKSYGYITSDIGTEPEMAWFMHNNDLIVCRNFSGMSAKINFNVAVIDSSGEGWITSYNETYDTLGYKVISIQTLTEDNKSTATDLSGYNIYVIIRGLPNVSSTFDFNSPEHEPPTNNKNVVDITPTSP